MDTVSGLKSDAFFAFKKLAKRLQNTCCSNIYAIHSDHEENSIMKSSAPFVKSLVSSTIYQLQELLSRMVWLKEITYRLKNWQTQY